MTLAASDMKWMEWARSVSLLLLSRVTTVLDELAGIVCERWRVQRVPREGRVEGEERSLHHLDTPPSLLLLLLLPPGLAPFLLSFGIKC